MQPQLSLSLSLSHTLSLPLSPPIHTWRLSLSLPSLSFRNIICNFGIPGLTQYSPFFIFCHFSFNYAAKEAFLSLSFSLYLFVFLSLSFLVFHRYSSARFVWLCLHLFTHMTSLFSLQYLRMNLLRLFFHNSVLLNFLIKYSWNKRSREVVYAEFTSNLRILLVFQEMVVL